MSVGKAIERTRFPAHLGLRWGALGLATIVAFTAFSTDTADARRRSSRAKPAKQVVQKYQPAYASLVVDANTGAVLQATNASSPRHPASLTKIMTLYLLFEKLEAGSIKLNTEMEISPHAAAQAPSKLALKPGQSIDVESAIKAVVTKSANDIAVVIAETVGGDEDSFAKMMTRKARALGMKNTTYKNASGLPNEDQITTAEDQVLLGRAIQERFPKYYRYFATNNFVYRGKAMRNHNKLLGSVEGVDGIKTGYTNASGFNLVTSLRRNGRHVVAAVFGGRTGNARDARMRELVGKYITLASNKKSDTVLAEKPSAPAPVAVAAAAPVPMPVAAPARTAPQLATAPTLPGVQPDAPLLGSTEPLKPNVVKTVAVKSTGLQSVAPASPPSDKLTPSAKTPVKTVTTVKTDLPPGSAPGVLGVLPAKLPVTEEPTTATISASTVKRTGYVIQIGAYDDEKEARQKLTLAQVKAKGLVKAEGFTETIAKGDKTLYRARFAGLDKDQAETACKQLKSSDVACLLLKE